MNVLRKLECIVSTVVAMLFSLSAFAQSGVKLALEEAGADEPVGFVTVTLTPEGSTKATKYGLADSEGLLTIPDVKDGKYTLKAELMGYKTITKEITVKGFTDLGVIEMEEDKEVLDAASVTAVGNPIIIKKDTIEYNASSFKTTENDVLEDLLKKLPGIEIGEDGSITSNGETITKITIDGKTFFLDDPQLASKNLPAKIIEKVKVVKKKSEQAEFTGIDDGEEETVIDLSVQKGMMNGLFGNAMAGGGHDVPSSPLTFSDGDYRYQGSLMAGRFTENSQISVILNGNNTNNRGFNDMAGSMMNSMMGGGGMGRGMGGFGRGGNGITTSWMGGLNGNFDLFDDKMTLGSNYLYNGTSTDVKEESYKETYLEDGSTLYNTNNGYSNTSTGGHRFGIELEHKFSENTSILFRPQFNIGKGSYNNVSEFSTETGSATGEIAKTNDGFTLNSGDNSSWQARGMFLFRQKLGIPGRTLSANIDWNMSNNTLDGFNQSLTNTYDETGAVTPTIVNQRIDQLAKQRSLGGRLVYTEPIGAGFYVEASYQYRWNQNTTDKKAYNSAFLEDYSLSGATMNYYREHGGIKETLDPDYTNEIVNRYINQSAGVAVMYQEDKLRAQLGVSANPTKTHNETNGKSYDDNRVNWAPRAMLFYDFNDNSNVRLFYFGRSAQPSTSQLMPVLDNSNPLSMALGNPFLAPYFSHSLRSDVEYSNKQTFFTMRFHLEGNYTEDPIVSAMWYDKGVQYSFPVNGKDSFNGNARLMINAPIAKSNFSLSNMTRVSYSSSSSYVGGTGMTGLADNYFNEDRTSFDYTGFHNDVDFDEMFTLNNTRNLSVVERFRATYRNDNIELTSSYRARMSKPWYTMETANANTTWAHQVNGSINWTPGDTGFTFTTDADYNWYRGYTTEQPSEFVWNASVSKTVFNKQGTIMLKAYDILDRAKNLTVTDQSNYHSEVRNNTLGRYIILSFTWRFGNFGKAGQQMRSRMGGGPPRF